MRHIDNDELKLFFLNGHTLGDCAREWNCSESTIKRRLRSSGVDTSRYNNSAIAKERSAASCRTYRLSDDDLRRLFIDDNLDTKTIAEMQNPRVHFNVVRKHVRRLGLHKDRKAIAKSMSSRHFRRYGIRHPAQRLDVVAKTRRSTVRAQYRDKHGRHHSFRSLHELGYALLLDFLNLEWYYEEMIVPYVDMMTGRQRVYVIDFTVVRAEIVEWIEVKPNSIMIPEDKRVYASRRAEEAGTVYRGLTDEELRLARDVLTGQLDDVAFLYNRPRRTTNKVTYYFLSCSDAAKYGLDGWRGATPKQIGGTIWSRTFRRSE